MKNDGLLTPLHWDLNQPKLSLQNEMSVRVSTTVELLGSAFFFQATHNHIWAIVSQGLMVDSYPSEHWGDRGEKTSDKAQA